MEHIVKDITWLAGLLEGEGCFVTQHKNSPKIVLSMTDADVVKHAAKLMGIEHITNYKHTSGGKIVYTFGVYGRRAAEWMMTLYCLMGERRRAAIRKALDLWKIGITYGTIHHYCRVCNINPPAYGRLCYNCYLAYHRNWNKNRRERHAV